MRSSNVKLFDIYWSTHLYLHSPSCKQDGVILILRMTWDKYRKFTKCTSNIKIRLHHGQFYNWWFETTKSKLAKQIDRKWISVFDRTFSLSIALEQFDECRRKAVEADRFLCISLSMRPYTTTCAPIKGSASWSVIVVFQCHEMKKNSQLSVHAIPYCIQQLDNRSENVNWCHTRRQMVVMEEDEQSAIKTMKTKTPGTRCE